MLQSKLSLAFSLAFGLTLTGCGGSATSSDKPEPEPINQAPVVNIENKVINEKEQITIVANVSDSDGSISSYKWKQLTDYEINLSANNNQVSFTAPEIFKSEQIKLQLTVTDDDGAQTSQEVTVDINQLTIETTIQGRVSHEDLIGGKASIKVGDTENYLVVGIDDTGEYQADLVVDDSQADAFITISAQGVDDKRKAKFVSMLGSLSHLREKAGNDQVLTVDENFSLNISSITTANYGLIRQTLGNELITDSEFEIQKLKLNPDDVLALTSAIELVLTSKPTTQTANKVQYRENNVTMQNNSVDLPEGTDDTAALVSNQDAAKTYVEQNQNTAEFTEQQQGVLSNNKLKDTSTYQVPESYYFLPTNTLTQSLGVAKFERDGTGIWFNTLDGKNTSEQDTFTWTESNGELTINFDTLDKAYTIKRYLSAGTYDDLVIDTGTTSKIYTAIKKRSTIPLNQNKILTAYLTLPMSKMAGDYGGQTVNVFADKFTFNDDGTGFSQLLDHSFNWEKDDNQLTISLSDNNVYRISQLNAKNDVSNHLVVEHVVNGGTSSITIGEGTIKESTTEWSAAAVVGIYKYDNAIFDSPLSQFWIELNADNSALTVNIADKDSNGIISDEEVEKFTGEWKIQSDGRVTVTRYRHKSDGNPSLECNAEKMDCWIFNTRTWELINESNDQFLLYQHHDFDDYCENYECVEYDKQQYDIRTIYKVTERPVSIE